MGKLISKGLNKDSKSFQKKGKKLDEDSKPVKKNV